MKMSSVLNITKRTTVRHSDKCLQAEIKNRVEIIRSRLMMKLLDKEKYTAEYGINRQKRHIVRQLQRTKSRTSGHCVAACPPDGPDDNTHHSSPYFMGGAAVSEKRLGRWKVKEKQVEKDKRLFADELKIPWEKKETELFGYSFQIVMGLLGYDADEIERTIKKAAIESEIRSNYIPINTEKQDVFGCLKFKSEYEVDGIDGTDKNESAFNVKKWEKDIIKDYKNLLSQSTNSKRIKSAPVPQRKTAFIEAQYPRAHTAFARVPNPRRRVRPQSASSASTRRVSLQSLEGRPRSAEASTVCTEDILRNDESDHSDDLSDVINGGEAIVNNSEMPKSVLNKDISLDIIDEIATDSENIKDVADNSHIKADKSTDINEIDREGISKKSLIDEEAMGELKKSDSNRMNKGHEIIDTVTEETSGSLTSHHVTKNRSISYAPNRVSFAGLRSSYDTKRKVSEPVYTVNSIQDDLEQSDIPGHQQPPSSSSNRRSSITQPGRRGSQYRVSTVSIPAKYPYETESELSRLPQWKRDLLMEAPPSLSGAKGPPKVNLIMSKSQRRRELQRLVEDQAADVRQICDQEQSRRIQSRQNVFSTMKKVQAALDNLVPTESTHDRAINERHRSSVVDVRRRISVHKN